MGYENLGSVNPEPTTLPSLQPAEEPVAELSYAQKQIQETLALREQTDDSGRKLRPGLNGLDFGEKGSCNNPVVAGLFLDTVKNESPKARDFRHLRAKEICRRCPIVTSCLPYALRNNLPPGVWGGQDDADLKKLKLAGRKP